MSRHVTHLSAGRVEVAARCRFARRRVDRRFRQGLRWYRVPAVCIRARSCEFA